jgi:hypothetical protein
VPADTVATEVGARHVFIRKPGVLLLLHRDRCRCCDDVDSCTMWTT